jgi:hypothetical protein
MYQCLERRNEAIGGTVMSLQKLVLKAQSVFNAWIRKRDEGKGCISCGKPIDHAGHYYAAGHYTALRFNEMNVNGQCCKCNTFNHGNLINYRKGLVRKYGEPKVLMLENSADLRKIKKWSRCELEAIINEYKF